MRSERESESGFESRGMRRGIRKGMEIVRERLEVLDEKHKTLEVI